VTRVLTSSPAAGSPVAACWSSRSRHEIFTCSLVCDSVVPTREPCEPGRCQDAEHGEVSYDGSPGNPRGRRWLPLTRWPA
jgi:hypothetical protein